MLNDTEVAAAVTLLLDAMEEPKAGCNYYLESDIITTLIHRFDECTEIGGSCW